MSSSSEHSDNYIEEPVSNSPPQEKEEPTQQNYQENKPPKQDYTNEVQDKKEEKSMWKKRRLIEDIDTGIKITVSDPQSRTENFKKKYIVYDVSGTDKHGVFNIKRRYNEFFALRQKLSENWPGIFMPSLPEKQKIGNFEVDFLIERTEWLDKFMKRSAKLPHIFYSESFQIFLRTSQQSVAKIINQIKRDNPTKMLSRYKKSFPKFTEETGAKTEASVNKYFVNLDKTINFFKEFRNIGKKMRSLKKDYNLCYLKFLSYTVIDYKNKLRREEKKKLEALYKEYVEEEKKDTMEEFVQQLKELTAELVAFEKIKKDIAYVRKETQRKKEVQTKYNNELSKVRSIEGEFVKAGMFKKVPKAEKIKELENNIEETTQDLNSLVELRMIIYNLLNFQEFPRLIDVKRRTFAAGLVNYANMKDTTITLELELLKSIQGHYKYYLDN